MVNFAVVKTGGKQYLVKEGMEITVDRLDSKEKEKIDLETLMVFSEDGSQADIGTPNITKKVQAEVLSHTKGEKIRIARFKSKVRFRKVMGFRSYVTTLKIVKI